MALLPCDLLQFPAYQPLSDVVVGRLIRPITHRLVKAISRHHATTGCLNLHNDGNQILPLAFNERFLVVVTLTTNWARFFVVPNFHEPLKALKASLVIDMRTAENRLLVKLQVLEADRACFFFNLLAVHPRKEASFDVSPFSLAQGLWRLFNKSEPLCQTQLADVFHPFVLDILVRTLLLFLAHCQHSLDVSLFCYC